MGCCLSTNNTVTETSKPSSLPKTNTTNIRTPFLEEKTVVKEVVSETSSTLPKQNEPTKEPLKHSSPNAKLQQNDIISKNPKMVVHNQIEKLPPSEELSEQVSEICSTTLSETNNLGDDSNEVTQTRNPSEAKYRNRKVSDDRLLGRAPNKRSEPSPGRVRSGPVGDGRALNDKGRRRGGSVLRPDRRSRSPATQVDGAGSRTSLSRCQSGRRTGKSPAWLGPPELGKKNSKLEQIDSKVENGGNSNGDTETKLDPRNDESLENPLVSLECFIFL